MSSQCHRYLIATLIVSNSVTALALDQESGEVFDPNAEVPPSEYTSVFSLKSSGEFLNASQLPWTGLYNSDGQFVPESWFGGSAEMTEDNDTSEEFSRKALASEEQQDLIMSREGTDSRGVVKKSITRTAKSNLSTSQSTSSKCPE